jgi:hypothetical protein
MPDDRLPFLRGKISKSERYQSPQGGGRVIALPPRNPREHHDRLIRDLDAVLAAVNELPPADDGDRRRGILAVVPEPGSQLDPLTLGDKRSDLRVVGSDPESGLVFLDAADPRMPSFRKKLSQYADPTKVNSVSGLPRNAKSLAPIQHVLIASENELAGRRLRAATGLKSDALLWFEVGCRGGVGRPDDTEDSRRQMRRALDGVATLPEFIAVEQIVFFVRTRLDSLATLIRSTDCIYEFDLAAPPTRDWLYSSHQPVNDLASFELARPADDAPAVAILDTGIATEHPLLKPAIRGAISALPDDSSPEDRHRHGTGMAGIALYGGGLGDALDAGQYVPPNWIESARILAVPYSGTGAEENRAFWPALTSDAVLGLERSETESRNRAFMLAVTTELGDVPFSTPWSQTIDQLAHNAGDGRLICVAAGNADTSDIELIKGYPQLNLAARLHDPAQAANALTVGAYTEKTGIPPEPIYVECTAVAPNGGISPYTRAGVAAGTLIKPDVVMEGGNVAFDGSLPSSMVETLSTLTTHPDFLRTPLTLTAMTSEATARAARLAAEIWAAAPDLKPETVRGLIVHSASWTPEMRAQFGNLDERLAACGLGTPDPEFALGCARDRATVIIEDSLPNSMQQAEGATMRVAKFFALPAPEEISDLDPTTSVELRVTLSYFGEPVTFRQRTTRGLDMKWEMQGPFERPEAFFKRVNKIAREPNERIDSRGYGWTLGPRRRARGTVQSDRYEGSPPLLAGTKYIAVTPVLGWWDRRPDHRLRQQRFSLIVTIQAEGSAIYTAIETALAIPIELTV